MWTAGGAGGSGFGGPGFGGQSDPGALAQQYWSALTEAMRSAGGGARQQDPWQAAMQQWSQLAGGGQSRNDAGDAIERFSAQARQWFGTMQQVAEQFAGKSASAQDIAAAWKQAMGGGGNPFASLLSGMTGRGQSGFEDWYAQIAPMLHGGMFNGLSGGNMLGGMRQEAMSWLQTPAFGHNREQQERWQALIAAQLELQQKNDAYNALMLEVGRDAFDRFERKLAERSEPGRQLQSARALFDLWIDAAEEAYAQTALSQEFRHVSGALNNAQMRLRAAIQLEVEHMTGLFGMPTRTEIDSAHRKIADLERALRRAGAASRTARPAPQPAQKTAKAAAPVDAPVEVAKAPVPQPHKAAAHKTAARKPARKPVVVAKAAPKPTAKRKLAAKPAQVKATPVAKKAAAAKTVPAKAVRSKPAVKKAAKAVKKAAKPVSRKPVAKAAAKLANKVVSRPAASSTPSAQVVSMKDWVARYAAANTPDAPKQKSGKKGARK